MSTAKPTKTASKTSQGRRTHSAKIAQAMVASGLPSQFILNMLILAAQDDVRSAYELMAIWEDAGENEEERNEAVSAMQELLDDIHNKAPMTVKPYIQFDQLADVAKKIMEHKARLREIIDRHGGVSRVAELSGIPQPSLSRMLTSASMPRRTTLYKIANALGLPETDIVTEFTR